MIKGSKGNNIGKTAKDTAIDLNQECVAKVVKTIGLDIDSQEEGYQVLYSGGTFIILVCVVKGINLEKFCK